MPIISSFFGIYVRMYFADHAPPHVHVEYRGTRRWLPSKMASSCKASCPSVRLPW
ncbi:MULTISPECIES: DUF4160 domain-containing protein [unclassified Rhodanobacter]|uniref:DUF4160 domain-containing protein n=1 Tax=unclassified Rhodanobacter TaxID=2621553 RepID=UPI0034E42D6A